jgi:hypothetical protein
MSETFCTDAEQLHHRLEAGEIVPVREEDWVRLGRSFHVVARHDTGLSGELVLARQPRRGRARQWVVVEEPQPDERVVRPVASEAAGRALIADRLATYERMWDGCSACKVDYYR